MTTIIQKLAPNLIREFRNADEIWIAVALISKDGLNYILDNVPKACRQHYLIGIDLPTDPKALKVLHDLELIKDVSVNIFSQKAFYHPKVYLTRQKDKYIAFLGSANCTSGGLTDNIEICVKLDEQKSCKDLLSWFDKLQEVAKPLTTSFLDKYASDYQTRQERKKAEERAAKKEKEKVNKEFEATLKKRSEFLKVLRKYRNNKNYFKEKKERDKVVKELRKSLAYPHFNKIEVDLFFSLHELGHIIPIPKPTIKHDIKKFSRLMRMICDESIDIATRYDRAVQGNLKIRGVSEGLISKVLTVHDPENYFIKNEKSDTALKKYGIQIPRGLSKGEKYKITAKFLKQICKETKIDDLAILDYYLYLEGLDKE